MRGLAVSSSQFIRTAQNCLARPADIRGALHAIATTTIETNKKAYIASSPATKRRKTARTPTKTKRKAVQNTDDRQETYHFIGYVPALNKVWELDGLGRCALEVGELTPSDGSLDSRKGWMDIVRPALRMKMQRYADGSDHIRYNLLAIVDDRYRKASDELEILKRERNVLERRLNEVYPGGWADKVDHTLLASAAEAFTTSLRPPSEGKVFSQDFGLRKMNQEIVILDMAARNLPAAWELCVKAAISAKVAVEDEIAKSRDAHTEQIKRTFDYEPFITQFITCLHNEGLLDGALGGKPANDDAQPKTPANKAKGKK